MPNSSSQLELLRSVADGIAALFFPNAEVVIHDLATNKIAYLANNLSKRKPGDDAGLEDFELDGGAGVTGPYEKLNWDGKKMRSVSIAARDEQGKPSYLLCINLSTAMFEDARNALDMFLSVTRLQPQPQQLFKDDWQEKINTFLHDWLRRENAALRRAEPRTETAAGQRSLSSGGVQGQKRRGLHRQRAVDGARHGVQALARIEAGVKAAGKVENGRRWPPILVTSGS